jgi:hypothetical protein
MNLLITQDWMSIKICDLYARALCPPPLLSRD